MPIVTSPTELCLCSGDGGATVVPANTATEIDAKYVKDAIIKGAQFAVETSAPVSAPVQPTIVEALERIITDGRPGDFNSLTKLPKVNVVSDIVGEKVTLVEIKAAWETMELSTVDLESGSD